MRHGGAVRKAGVTSFTVALLAGVMSMSAVADVVESAQRTNASQDAKITAEQQRAIDAYGAELRRVQAGPENSLEPLLAAAGRIKALLNEPPGPREQPRPQV